MSDDERMMRRAFAALKRNAAAAPDFERTIRGQRRIKAQTRFVMVGLSMAALLGSALVTFAILERSAESTREQESLDRALLAIAQSELEPLGFLTTVPSISFDEGP